MAFTPPGRTSTLPMVASAPWVHAARRAMRTASASTTMASRRSASGVVPAWLATPGMSRRQRPCGQMCVPTPTGYTEPDQPAALLDVQLDEGADPAQALGIGADLLRPASGGT